MSDRDRVKWNAKYAAISSPMVTPLDPWLAELVQHRPPGRALDVACGLGSIAIGLAQRGWAVTGVDISSVGLAQARQSAEQQGVSVDWVCADLETYSPGESCFDLITVFRYLQRGELCQRLTQALKLSGMLLHVTFVEGPTGDLAIAGRPQNPAFILRTGELAGLYPELRALEYSESLAGQAGYAMFAGVRAGVAGEWA